MVVSSALGSSYHGERAGHPLCHVCAFHVPSQSRNPDAARMLTTMAATGLPPLILILCDRSALSSFTVAAPPAAVLFYFASVALVTCLYTDLSEFRSGRPQRRLDFCIFRL
jgi:hypothetical protein